MSWNVVDVLAGALILLLITPGPGRGQEPERYAVVVTDGVDTVAVERVTRTGEWLHAVILVRDRARLEVTETFGPSRCATGAVMDVFPWGSAEGSTPLQHVAVTLDGDSVRVETRVRDVHQQMARELPGQDAVVADSYAASALAVECALSGGLTELDVVAFPNFRSETHVFSRDGDVVTVTGDVAVRARIGADGRPVQMEFGDRLVRIVPFDDVASELSATPEYTPPPGASYGAEEIRIPVTEGVTLSGTLTVPGRRDGRVPGVVLVSGGGAQDRDSYAPIGGGWRPFRELADALSSRGVAVLRFDDRGVGFSTGDQGSATERDAVADVSAAVRFLRARDDVDGGRIVVLGHSEGARVAMWVAAEDPLLAGVALMAGAADTRAATRAQAIWAFDHGGTPPGLSRDSVLARIDRQMDSLAVSGSREVFRWDANALASRIRVPVAVFHGATDRQVPVEQAEVLAALFGGPDAPKVTLRIFADVNHLFLPDPSGDFLQYGSLESGRLDPSVLRAVTEWVSEVVGPVGGRGTVPVTPGGRRW